MAVTQTVAGDSVFRITMRVSSVTLSPYIKGIPGDRNHPDNLYPCAAIHELRITPKNTPQG